MQAVIGWLLTSLWGAAICGALTIFLVLGIIAWLDRNYERRHRG